MYSILKLLVSGVAVAYGVQVQSAAQAKSTLAQTPLHDASGRRKGFDLSELKGLAADRNPELVDLLHEMNAKSFGDNILEKFDNPPLGMDSWEVVEQVRRQGEDFEGHFVALLKHASEARAAGMRDEEQKMIQFLYDMLNPEMKEIREEAREQGQASREARQREIEAFHRKREQMRKDYVKLFGDEDRSGLALLGYWLRDHLPGV